MNIEPVEPEPILLELVPEGSHFRRAQWLPRDAAAGVVVALVVAGIIYAGSLGIFTRLPVIAVAALNGVLELGVLLAFPLWLLRKRSVPYPGPRPPRRLMTEILLAIPVTIGVLILVAIVANLAQFVLKSFDRPPDTPMDFWGRMSPRAMLPIAVLAVAIAPVVEEIFFRGFLYNALRRVCPAWIAIIAQALLFGLGHVYEPLGVVVTFVIGLVLAAIYEWRKTLLAPMLVHCMWNSIVMLFVAIMVTNTAHAPMIGVTFSPEAGGPAVVEQVLPGSPAEEAGIQPGDVIESYDGRDVTDSKQLIGLVREGRVGDEVTLKILRGQTRIKLQVTLRSRGEVE